MISYMISATISLVIMAALSFIIPDPSQAHSTLIVGIIAFFTIIAMLAVYVAFGVVGWTIGFLANKFSTKQKNYPFLAS